MPNLLSYTLSTEYPSWTYERIVELSIPHAAPESVADALDSLDGNLRCAIDCAEEEHEADFISCMQAAEQDIDNLRDLLPNTLFHDGWTAHGLLDRIASEINLGLTGGGLLYGDRNLDADAALTFAETLTALVVKRDEVVEPGQ